MIDGLRNPRSLDRAIAWALFAVSFLVLFATQASVGFVRDESVYFEAAESCARWLQQLFQSPATALADQAIVRAFDFNHEHPVLMKMLFGVSHLLFHRTLGWLSPAAAFRVPAFAVASIIPPLLYLFGRDLSGRQAGLFAGLSFFLVPRQFFNAHLACFDIPVAAFWLLTVFAFWRAQDRPRYWIWCGISFGLALSTKHNAWLLPLVLAPFALWSGWRCTKDSPPARQAWYQLLALYIGTAAFFLLLRVSLGAELFQKNFLLLSPGSALLLVLGIGTGWFLLRLYRLSLAAFRSIAPLCAMSLLGPAIFYLHWPYLWYHPVDRIAWYFAFHTTHNHYAWFYLGKLLREPPFPLEYVLVKTALTVPLSLFLPMVLGLGAIAVKFALGRVRWADLLVGANAAASIVIISHPDVPHFGGVKHWFPSMCFLGLLAGQSVARAGRQLAASVQGFWAPVPGWAVVSAFFLLLLIPPAIATARIHPYGTSYYSELAGGLPGAATLGMQRQFWSNNVTGVLPWINAHAPRNARLWLHEVTGFAFRDYQLNGMLRTDIQPAGGPAEADVAAYQYHQEFREQEFAIWQEFGTQRPATGLYLDETPQVMVYRRRLDQGGNR